MNKIKIVYYKSEDGSLNYVQHQYFCLGCKIIHGFNSGIHTYNNDPKNPTITPSLLTQYTYKDKPVCCHSFITNGMQIYANDCTHELVGKTVELPEIAEQEIL